MVENDQGVVASKATIARLPGYLGYLRDKQAEGVENISSTAIAEDLRLNAVQVRKDLAFVSSVAGRPKLGFAVSDLILDIERFLGYDNVTDAVLVGAGGLGRTLMGYEGFKTYGLNIEAAFDVDSDLIGRRVHGKPVFALEKLPGVVKRLNIHIGIITVAIALIVVGFYDVLDIKLGKKISGRKEYLYAEMESSFTNAYEKGQPFPYYQYLPGGEKERAEKLEHLGEELDEEVKEDKGPKED